MKGVYLVKKLLTGTLALSMATVLALSLCVPAFATDISLNDGTTLSLSDNALKQSAESPSIGGGMGLFNYSDFTDLAAYPEAKAAVNWWLSCGVTNGGETWDTFGATSHFNRYELAFFLYRYYGITNDDGMWFYKDVPINQMGSTIGLKFNDPVTNCRWSGIMAGVGNDCFDPFGSVSLEQLLTVLYRLVNYKDGTINPAAVTEGVIKDPSKTTMQVNANFDVTLPTLTADEANAVIAKSGITCSDWAKKYVASLIQSGLYTPAAGIKGTDNLNKLQVIEVLYAVCKGTGGTQQCVNAFESSNILHSYNMDTTLKDTSFSANDPEYTDTTLLQVSNGAKVTMTDGSIEQKGEKWNAGSSYPLCYRWANAGTVVVSGKDSKLTLDGTSIDMSGGKAHQSVSGFNAICGGTIVFNNVNYLSDTSSLICYDGTIIYNNCKLNNTTMRLHSSDFFSGVMVYSGCNVNADVKDTTATTAFNDEATSVYVVNSNFNNGIGALTGVAYWYFENSTVRMGDLKGTNNTSMLTDVASATFYKSSVNWEGTVYAQRESKVQLSYVDCGKIGLAADGYDIYISGTEFGTNSSVRIILDKNSYFGDALNV